jgi:hypothetical protein
MEKLIINESVALEYIGELHFSSPLYRLIIESEPILNHQFISKYLVIDENVLVITEFTGNTTDFVTHLWVLSTKTKEKLVISSMSNGFVIPKRREGDKLIYNRRNEMFTKEYEQNLNELIF